MHLNINNDCYVSIELYNARYFTKDNIYDEELAEKIERKHKSAHLQVTSLDASVDKLYLKLDTLYSAYIQFFN